MIGSKLRGLAGSHGQVRHQPAHGVERMYLTGVERMLPAYARRLSSNAEPIEIVPEEIVNDVTVAVWFRR